MKIRFLLLGTSLSLIPNLTFGQCVATQDCETLGYTETSCNGGKGVKCPFGNKWACLTSEEECLNIACDKLGFRYTCTGTGYASGGGETCNGKYSYCNCSSPYTWSNGACTCDSIYQYTCSGTGYSGGSGTACGGKYTACTCTSGYVWNGSSCQIYNGEAIGDLYYCNGKVVGVRATGMDFYVAMKDLGIMEWSYANRKCQSYTFCGNLKGSLPTREQLLSIYNNKSRVNTLLSTNKGTEITEVPYWSSTNGGGDYYYYVHMYNGRTDDYLCIDDFNVRPILTSW